MSLAETVAGKAIKKIPIALLTGSLGSGKTTLLRQIGEHYALDSMLCTVDVLAGVGQFDAQPGSLPPTCCW